jgi:hypothetical protein
VPDHAPIADRESGREAAASEPKDGEAVGDEGVDGWRFMFESVCCCGCEPYSELATRKSSQNEKLSFVDDMLGGAQYYSGALVGEEALCWKREQHLQTTPATSPPRARRLGLHGRLKHE